MQEEFRQINGYENLYQISNLGNVKSLISNKIIKGRSSKGYRVVSLHKNNSSKAFGTHRLVAFAFIPNPEPVNKTQVDHINNHRSDNRAENLRWASPSENCQNTGLSKANKLGVKGVFYSKIRKELSENIGYELPCYLAQVFKNGVNYNLGYYHTLEEAKIARQKKSNELFGEYVNKIEKIQNEVNTLHKNMKQMQKEQKDELEELEKEFNMINQK